MARIKGQRPPRNFFLNETHELTPDEKGGGGGLPKFEGISWSAKGKKISQSLETAVETITSSRDPLKKSRFFLVAEPVEKIKKRREDKKGKLKEIYEEKPAFGGLQGKLFDRLGLDLLQVTDDGKAVVHGEPERIEQLKTRTATLDRVGPLEQSRWAALNSFQVVPLELRVDADWLAELAADKGNDIVVELQPVLTRLEADTVLRAITAAFDQSQSGKLTGTGTDYSGRHWFRGKASRAGVRSVAKDFFSVQAIHSPLYSMAAAKGPSATKAIIVDDVADPSDDPLSLPCVAVVDLGVPKQHKQLAKFRRSQFYPPDAPSTAVGDHGAFVASRVVFGDHTTPEELQAAVGQCSFWDAMVGDYPAGPGQQDRVNDKIVLAAMTGVRSTAPDVRVFNLSFGDTRHLDDFNQIDREQKRLDLQHLDNFVFENDSIVVVAAGNSQPGVVPEPAYPGHHADKRWALGPWACGFNTLVCGSFINRLSAGCHVRQLGWPSPFTRIGPGLCESRVPCFSAPGGNVDDNYNKAPGTGVWGFSGIGLPEDRVGTSYSAPILAREAALTLAELQRYCLPGAQPFGITARAFLGLTATRPVQDVNVLDLVLRTLGDGQASVARLIAPSAGSAVILWQGYIESSRDKVRVQLPIPRDWLAEASDPLLRIVICADPPVNAAAHQVWACRKVVPVLHASADGRGVTAPRGGHPSFPAIDRTYKLSRYKPDGDAPAPDDLWLLELSYEEIAPYPPGMEFNARQRVAFAAELLDAGAAAADPQAAMQDLPIAQTMTRLSVQATPIRSPIIIRTR